MAKSFFQKLKAQTGLILLLLVGAAYFTFAGVTGTCPACVLIDRLTGSDPAQPGQTNAVRSDFNLHDSGWVFETVDGALLDSASFEGKAIIVNYWATWCGPCVKEIPEFSRVASERDDVVIIGISVDQNPGQLSKFLERGMITYPVVHMDLRPGNLVGQIRSIPTTLVFDAKGRFVEKKIGILSQASLEALIDKHSA
jgi:thiol-disulfide isomerase/thioredoxin